MADIKAAVPMKDKLYTQLNNKYHKYDKMDGSLPVGGRVFLMKTNIAFSAPSLILFRTTYTNCPIVKSAGTRYLCNQNK